MQRAIACEGIAEACRVYHDDEELRAQRVSARWLEEYLEVDQLAAILRLSVFLGSFDAAGAAAVFCGLGVPLHLLLLLAYLSRFVLV